MRNRNSILMSLILIITVVINFSGIVFSSESTISKQNMDGTKYSVTLVKSDSEEEIIIVNYNGYLSKTVYNKKANVVDLYKLGNISQKNTVLLDVDNFEEIFISRTQLDENMDLVENRSSVSDYYTCEYFPNYSYSMNGSYGYLQFNLNITNDSLTTPYINSSKRAYGDSFDFLSCIKSADSYFEASILNGLGFLPGYAVLLTIADISEDLQNGLTQDAFISLVIAFVESIPGLGTVLSTAELASNASLSAAQLANAKIEFRNVRTYMYN